jgi:hypothetical protein
MDNFDLRKYLAEGKLLKEEYNPYKTIEDFLVYNLDVYLEGDMEAEAANEFILYKDDYTDDEYMDDADIEYFAKTAEKLKSGDIKFSSEDYLYDGVASLKGEDIEIKFKDRSVAEGKLLKEEQGENDRVVAFLNANIEAVKQHMRDEFFDDAEGEEEYNEEMGEEIDSVTSFEGADNDDDLAGAIPNQEIGISYMLKDDYDALEDKTRFETDYGFPPADVKIAGKDLKFITYSI